MRSQRILYCHQGAEEYGSDKILLIVAKNLRNKFETKVLLDSDGPLVARLRDVGIEDVCIMNLGVLRRGKLGSASSVLAFAREFTSAILEIRKIVRSYRPDVIYSNTLAVVAPLFAGIGTRSTAVHHLHEIQKAPRLLFRILYSVSCLLSDRIICVSRSVKECLLEMSFLVPSNVYTIFNGLPKVSLEGDKAEALKAELGAAFGGKPVFLIAYVARINSWKGQLEFLEVLKILKCRYNADFKVAFFGDVFPGYEYVINDIRLQAERYNLAEEVRFFGFRSDAEVLFSLADVSIMGSTQPDPLPTVVLESMQQGTPVVAYAHGGSTEMIEDGVSGFLVPPGDFEKMARAIHSLCSNRALLEEFGRESKRKFAREFSEESFSKNVAKALE